MDKIIYVVTTGEYSDYHIDSIWDTLEKAQEQVNKINSATKHLDERSFIEEYWLNKAIDPKVIWTVIYDRTTGEWECEDWDGTTYKLDEVEQLDGLNFKQGVYYRVKLRADSRTAALKIANERIMKLIAMEKPCTK